MISSKKKDALEERSEVEIVDSFFSRFSLLVDNVKEIEIDRSAIRVYLSDPDRRDRHMLAALSDIESYVSVVEDVLLTATELSKNPSVASEELLVDWMTTAPEFALDRLKPDAWRISAHIYAMEAWDAGASNNSTAGHLYNAM